MLKIGAAAAGHDRTGQDTVDLNAVPQSAIGEGFSDRNDRGVDGSDGGIGCLRKLRRVAGDENHRTLCGFESVPGAHGQSTGAMQLERHARIPLLVRHFEEIDLGNGARDIEQRVNFAELF